MGRSTWRLGSSWGMSPRFQIGGGRRGFRQPLQGCWDGLDWQGGWGVGAALWVVLPGGWEAAGGCRRGFRSEGAGGDFASLFKAVGMALIGKVGGASGPLYGSFYLAVGKQLGDVAEVSDRRGQEGISPASSRLLGWP